MDDDKFYEILYDINGNPVRVLKNQILPDKPDTSWPEYDSSKGHCGLCGRLGCNVNCIQGGS